MITIATSPVHAPHAGRPNRSVGHRSVGPYLLILAAVVLGLSSCGGPSESAPDAQGTPPADAEQRPTVGFELTEELLGSPVEFPEAGLRLQPPLGWFVFTGQQSEQVQDTLAPLLNPDYSYRTHELFFDGETNTVLLVATPSASISLEEHAEYYRDTFRVQELRADRFMHGEYELDQLILVEPSMVLLRYLLRHAEHGEVEIIFAVPITEFATLIPLIESVVGSALPL